MSVRQPSCATTSVADTVSVYKDPAALNLAGVATKDARDLDINGLHVNQDGSIYITFSNAFIQFVPGVTGLVRDEDVLLFDPNTSMYSRGAHAACRRV